MSFSKKISEDLSSPSIIHSEQLLLNVGGTPQLIGQVQILGK
jgi:hypothetical protein